MRGRGETFVGQDTVADNLAVIHYPLAFHCFCQEEVLCFYVLDPHTIPGKICNFVRFVPVFYAVFVVFYPFVYQFLCVKFRINRIRDPSPDRSTKKSFVIGSRSFSADVAVDCEAKFCKV